MDAMKIANSIPMWIACGIPVILVIAQALIFAKKSYSAGKKIGLTEKQMKNAIKSSAITSKVNELLQIDWSDNIARMNAELLLRFLNLEEKI